jgi:hypothetical protein
MHAKTISRWLLLLALLAVGGWWIHRYLDTTNGQAERESPIEPAAGTNGLEVAPRIENPAGGRPAQEAIPAPPASDSSASTPAPPATPRVGPGDRGDDGLKSVQSPLARRYLRFLLPAGGRLAKESSGISIVHAAFGQAWGVSARLNLSPAQQDSLAQLLLREDWLSWEKMDPKDVRTWAETNLSPDQQAGLEAYLRERKQGNAMLDGLKQAEYELEHGDLSGEAALAAEAAVLMRLLASTGTVPGTTGFAGVGMTADKRQKHAALARIDAAARPYKLLADRIPLTEKQRVAVFDALRSGAKPPNNPYDYLSAGPDRVARKVRDDTRWLEGILTDGQYATYVAHFLAEIEVIKSAQTMK